MAKSKNPKYKRGVPIKKARNNESPITERHIDFPRELWEQIHKAAKDAGMTKSQLVCACVSGMALVIDEAHVETLSRLAERRGLSVTKTVEALIDHEAAYIRAGGGKV